MKVVRLDENNWAIVAGLRLVASGFESEAIALSYISLVTADDDVLTNFCSRGEGAAEGANYFGNPLKGV